jgi:hypothetical protein
MAIPYSVEAHQLLLEPGAFVAVFLLAAFGQGIINRPTASVIMLAMRPT